MPISHDENLPLAGSNALALETAMTLPADRLLLDAEQLSGLAAEDVAHSCQRAEPDRLGTVVLPDAEDDQ